MDLARPELYRLQMGTHTMLEFFFTAGAGAFADGQFQVAVEQFVRVVLRGIRWQIEHLNLFPVLFKPSMTASMSDQIHFIIFFSNSTVLLLYI